MINEQDPVVPEYDRPINIMIDIETTGKKAGCGILSIGAVVFLVGDGKQHKFYMGVLPESNEWVGLEDDEDTMNWWKTQDAEVRAKAFGGQDALVDVLEKFNSWIASLTKQPAVWGNGASFDIKIMEAAYRACGVDVPWSYRDEMCFRTLNNLFAGQVLWENVPGFVAHDALWDAINQANHAEKCYIAMSNTIVAATQWITSQNEQKSLEDMGLKEVNPPEAFAALNEPLP